MQIQNYEIAQKFNEVADLLEINGANPFRVRAYRNAARTILNLSEKVSDVVQIHGDLTSYPGIGKDLAAKIEELVTTGHMKLLDKIEKETPTVLREMLNIPMLGPKRAQLLHKTFKIKSLQDLKKITQDKSILELHGFGEKIRLAILAELNKNKHLTPHRLKLFEAEALVDLLSEYLKKSTDIKRFEIAGSFRRRRETVGDIDILATAKNSFAAIKYFLKFDGITKTLSQGPSRSTVILRSGTQIDLRVVPDDSYGAALLYLTGSKSHNIALRSMAQKQGLKINEYGIFRGKQRLASQSEEDIYQVLRLPYITPELRENRGEIEAALKNELPKLVRRQDILGDLHIHSNATDGIHTIKEMALAAKDLGYSYIAVTDHSKRVTIAHGLDEDRLLKQLDEIDKLNSEFKDFVILKSIEVDILKDGQLDLPNEILEKLDLTVCAVHSHFRLTKNQQTQRLLRAMENPYFTILAHPTGRLIEQRDAYEFDFEKIIAKAKELGRIIEVNAQPDRMDISDTYCKMAKEAGVKLALSTDSHSTSQLQFMKYGVDHARRGWLEKEDVINTLPPQQLLRFIHGLR